MRRPVTAWVALLAMLSGLALPAHACAHVIRATQMGGDLCTADAAARPTPAPAPAHHATACDVCCGYAGGASAPPGAIGQAVIAAASVVPPDSAARIDGAPTTRIAFARGPPGAD